MKKSELIDDLMSRLETACDNWSQEDFGVIPIAIVRGILRRYDEVHQLNVMVYGEDYE
jgi:hypothetical protein